MGSSSCTVQAEYLWRGSSELSMYFTGAAHELLPGELMSSSCTCYAHAMHMLCTCYAPHE